MQQTIYLADDEQNIRNLISAFLTQEGFRVQAFSGGDALLAACKNAMPDLVILDVMMPGTDGFSICAQLRQKSAELPIIIVSGKDTPIDRVTGLTLGSDDYLIKPFLPLELVARVRALLRRSRRTASVSETPRDLSLGPLTLSPSLRTARLRQQPLVLTPTEFDFLQYLLKHQERAVSRDELLQALWQMDEQYDTRAADDLVKRLRKKLREKQSPVRVETVWGFGFRLALDEDTL